MPKNRKVATSKSRLVADLPRACSDEATAVDFMERQRWGDEPVCPHCGCTGNVYQMRDRKTGERNKRFLWRCRDCGQQYTVRVGTIMEDSPIPLRHWCYAFWAACSSKKGVSAKQIERMTGVTYKSALFMMHRVRWAMAPANEMDGGPLKGTVEVDETYIGGKKPKHLRKTGRPNPKDKAAVIGMVERDGRLRMRHLANLKAPGLRAAIREHIDRSSRLMTDEYNLYTTVGGEFEGGHQTVCHSAGEYARGDASTNTIEAVFALLKRGVYGTFHSISRKHLHRYLSEFEFRYNTRKVDDGERTRLAIKAAVSRRLTYKEQVGHA
jgi:transposase-like protein